MADVCAAHLSAARKEELEAAYALIEELRPRMAVGQVESLSSLSGRLLAHGGSRTISRDDAATAGEIISIYLASYHMDGGHAAAQDDTRS